MWKSNGNWLWAGQEEGESAQYRGYRDRGGPTYWLPKALPIETINAKLCTLSYLHGLIWQIFIGHVPGTKQGCEDEKKSAKSTILAFDKVSSCVGGTAVNK